MVTLDLKQSTATTITLGPFTDSADIANETGLTIAQADIRLSKNGGSFAQTHNATGATAMENGWYSIPLDTTDTNTLGILDVYVYKAGVTQAWKSFNVVTANVWDSKYSTDVLDVSVTQWTGTAVGTPATAGYPAVTIKDGTGTGELDTSSGGVILTTAAVDSIWDEALSGHSSAGTSGKAVADTVAAVDTEIAAIKLKTDNLPASPAAVGSAMTLATGSITAAVIALDAIDADAISADALAEIADAVCDEAIAGHTGFIATNLNAKVGDVKTKTDTITWSDITFLFDMLGGKREIVGTQEICYKADGMTEICRFNLFDAGGSPTNINIYSRVRV